MGKVGRFACILTPMVLTLASLITFIIVMMGQMPWKGNDAPATALGRDLYFFKADTSNITLDQKTILDKLPEGIPMPSSSVLDAIQGTANSGVLKDFYQVGLFSYCEGDRDEKTGAEKITYCSPRKFQFYFNPMEVWQLNGTSVQNVLGDDFDKGMKVYKKVAGWMNWAFVITLILTAAEFIIGFFAIFSRWGSLITTIVSTAQTVFALAAAITATAVYGTLLGAFKSIFNPLNIEAKVGSQMLAALWIAVAFSVASGFFWLISVCCCSGKSPHKKVSIEKTPYTYERVSSPAFGQKGGHEMQSSSQWPSSSQQAHHQATPTAYEPFRSRV